MVGFEWNDAKSQSNQRKHGVSFVEAATVFQDEFARVMPDPDHSIDEQRYLLLGEVDDASFGCEPLRKSC